MDPDFVRLSTWIGKVHENRHFSEKLRFFQMLNGMCESDKNQIFIVVVDVYELILTDNRIRNTGQSKDALHKAFGSGRFDAHHTLLFLETNRNALSSSANIQDLAWSIVLLRILL